MVDRAKTFLNVIALLSIDLNQITHKLTPEAICSRGGLYFYSFATTFDSSSLAGRRFLGMKIGCWRMVYFVTLRKIKNMPHRRASASGVSLGVI